MAGTRARQAAEVLRQQANEAFRSPEIVGPQQALYGVFGQQYAGAMNAASQDPYFGGTNRIALQLNSLGEDTQYARELAATREAQLAAQETAGYYGLQDKLIDLLPDDAPIGTYQIGNSADGHYGIQFDPAFQVAHNATMLDDRQADTYKTKAEGVGELADAGYGLTPEGLSTFLRPSLENPDTQPTYGVYSTPADRTRQYAADEGMTVEEQFAFEEAKAKYKQMYPDKDPDAVEWTQEINPVTGIIEWKAKGSRAGLERDGLNPPGTSPNPNAGAQAPGASATTGSVNNFYARPNSRRGMRRDPINGTQRMHNGDDFAYPAGTPYPAEQDGTVVSVGPMRGFGPHTVVVEYDDGSQVLYGHGQAANVVAGQRIRRGQTLGLVGSEGRSTGPHVHRQVQQAATRQARNDAPARQASNREAPVRTSKIETLAQRAADRGLTVTADEATNTVVFTDPRSGRTMRYDMDGNVVGG